MTKVNADGQGPQNDSAETADASEPDDDETPQDDDQETDDDSDQDDDASVRSAEAKRYRLRLRETQALLQLHRKLIIAAEVDRLGYKPALADEVDTADLLSDGVPDREKIKAVITARAEAVGASPRRQLMPNPQQGTAGPQRRGASSWSSALKGH